MSEKPLIVCCYTHGAADWTWLAGHFPEYRWRFVPPVANGRVAMSQVKQAVRLAKREKAALLVTHGPHLAMRCGLWRRLTGAAGIPLLAWSFHYDVPPTGLKARLIAMGMRGVDLAIVFSTAEVELYHEIYRIPRGRIQMAHWGIAPPADPPPTAYVPENAGNYASAIGGSARDYATLFAAAAQAPEVPLVVVARPHNLEGLAVPAHVKVEVNIPYERMQGILRHSRFTVVPLDAQARSGHSMAVQAWFLRRPLIITDVLGVSDYLRSGENALGVPPADPAALASAMRRLWQEEALRRSLEAGGLQFALAHCTEDATVNFLGSCLRRLGVVRRRQELSGPEPVIDLEGPAVRELDVVE